jgi:hypothetical protein
MCNGLSKRKGALGTCRMDPQQAEKSAEKNRLGLVFAPLESAKVCRDVANQSLLRCPEGMKSLVGLKAPGGLGRMECLLSGACAAGVLGLP